MEKCAQAGCAGTITDGKCSVCGQASAVPDFLPTIIAPARSQAVTQPTTGQATTPVSGPAQASGSVSTGTGSGPVTSGTRSRTGSASASAGLGAGFISLPPLPSMDPMQAVMAEAMVPVNKRFCSSCQKKVTDETGVCPHCGTSYDFVARLKVGDVVGSQYEVKGPMAFGGLGWIYLAQDLKLKKRWVVLKGLLNAQNEAAAAVALQEREFLSAVKHPNIVGVYNFVTHNGTDEYIVMEYVKGKNLYDLRKERGVLPAAEAIAYMHRVLSAFGYLHENGMVYCDFKPANVMLEDDVKLIDLGGVRRVTDTLGNVYGTRGFFAPEIESGANPSISSDLYTVARSLAMLMFNFDFQKKYQYSLPPPSEEPLFAAHDSLYYFLKKATRDKPEERYQTAGEMADQLLGVLRDVVAGSGSTRVIDSHLFGNDAIYSEYDAQAVKNPEAVRLPPLKLDAADPAATDILSCAATIPEHRVAYLERIAKQYSASIEARLRLAEACAAAGDFNAAERHLKTVESRDPQDWRVLWFRGQVLIKQKKFKEAQSIFHRVYEEIPGELASKLAYAQAAELAGQHQTAIKLYDLIGRCDPSYSTAAFGMARCMEAVGDRTGAAGAFERIPANSSAYTLAQTLLVRTLTDAGKVPPGEAELLKASGTITALSISGFLLHDLRATLLAQTIERVEKGSIQGDPSSRVLGEPFEPRRLRFALERELRECARYSKTPEDKLTFVDRANKERPWTLV